VFSLFKGARTAIVLLSIYSVIASQIVFESVRGRGVNIYDEALNSAVISLKVLLEEPLRKKSFPKFVTLQFSTRIAFDGIRTLFVYSLLVNAFYTINSAREFYSHCGEDSR